MRTYDGMPYGWLYTQRDAAIKAIGDAACCLEQAIEDEGEEVNPYVVEAYERLRAAMGKPISSLPGGPEGSHFHFLDQHDCSWCAEREGS